MMMMPSTNYADAEDEDDDEIVALDEDNVMTMTMTMTMMMMRMTLMMPGDVDDRSSMSCSATYGGKRSRNAVRARSTPTLNWFRLNWFRLNWLVTISQHVGLSQYATATMASTLSWSEMV